VSEEYSDGQKKLLADVRLAVELRGARQTVLYQWLMETARLAALAATEELVKADPANWRAIANLQAEVKRFYDINAWIDGTIQRGEIAEHQFNAQQGIDESAG
jgi:hypothetical protein